MLKYFLKVSWMYIVCIEVLGNGFCYENLIVVCEVSKMIVVSYIVVNIYIF